MQVINIILLVINAALIAAGIFICVDIALNIEDYLE